MSPTSDFDPDILHEFILDASELIKNAALLLIKLEDGQIKYIDGYRSIFNVLHTLKGSLAMFGYQDEMNYIHLIENDLKSFENHEKLDCSFVNKLSKSLNSLEAKLKDPQSPLYMEEVKLINKALPKITNEYSDSQDKSIYFRVSSSNSHTCLLVIDDNTLVLDSFIEYFGKRFKVCSVTNVNDGIIAIQKNQDIHIIFCDFHMPRDKGTKLLDYLNQNKIDIPVIVMSDLADRKDLLELLKRHAFYFVEKQEGFQEFERALNKAQRERMKQLSTIAKKLILD